MSPHTVVTVIVVLLLALVVGLFASTVVTSVLDAFQGIPSAMFNSGADTPEIGGYRIDAPRGPGHQAMTEFEPKPPSFKKLVRGFGTMVCKGFASASAAMSGAGSSFSVEGACSR